MNKKIRKLLLDIYYVMDSGRHHKWFLCLQWENHIVCSITNSSDSSFTNLEFRTYDFLAKICHDSFLNRQTEENSVLFRPRRNSWKKLEEQIRENIWWIRYYIVQGRWKHFRYGCAKSIWKSETDIFWWLSKKHLAFARSYFHTTILLIFQPTSWKYRGFGGFLFASLTIIWKLPRWTSIFVSSIFGLKRIYI